MYIVLQGFENHVLGERWILLEKDNKTLSNALKSGQIVSTTFNSPEKSNGLTRSKNDFAVGGSEQVLIRANLTVR